MNLIIFIELHSDGNPIRWSGTGMNRYGWDRMEQKDMSMNKPDNIC